MARPVKDPDSSYICLDIAPQLLSGFAGSVMEQKYLLPALADPTGLPGAAAGALGTGTAGPD